MEKFDKILEYVRKTNPNMTKDELMREMKKCKYGSIALGIVTIDKNCSR